MAAPIKITPVLTGKASVQFNTSLKENSGKVSSAERERITSIVQRVLSKGR